MVAERGMLVEAHEREERVEDLVVDLDPAVPFRRRRERSVEQAEEEEHQHAAGDADAEQPEQQRNAHGILEPLLANDQCNRSYRLGTAPAAPWLVTPNGNFIVRFSPDSRPVEAGSRYQRLICGARA